MGAHFLFLALLALASSHAIASDPSQLQDFCVADRESDVFVNGFVCKDPKMAKAEDFFFWGLDKPRDTGNKLGSNVTQVNVNQIPGLNTLGISLARLDFAPYGVNPPHTHPRGTEILTVLEGTLYVGFVTSNPDQLFTKVLHEGGVFVFPQGLIHFQFNNGKTGAVAIAGLSSQNPGVSSQNPGAVAIAGLSSQNPGAVAVAIAGLSSQNPGVITIANAVFGAKPPISDDVLAKAFQLDKKTVDWLQAQFWMDNNN